MTGLRTLGKPLEAMVADLEKTLAGSGVSIVVRDRVRDRVTGRLREVDVSLRSHLGSRDILVIVECRDRGRRDDVTWIEQLAEKRRSLGASRAVAVSVAGFTKPARVKAAAVGIEVRVMKSLSRSEFLGWLGIRRVLVGRRVFEFHSCAFLAQGATQWKSILRPLRARLFPTAGGAEYSMIELLHGCADKLEVFPALPVPGWSLPSGGASADGLDAHRPVRRVVQLAFEPAIDLADRRSGRIRELRLEVTARTVMRLLAFREVRTYDSFVRSTSGSVAGEALAKPIAFMIAPTNSECERHLDVHIRRVVRSGRTLRGTVTGIGLAETRRQFAVYSPRCASLEGRSPGPD